MSRTLSEIGQPMSPGLGLLAVCGRWGRAPGPGRRKCHKSNGPFAILTTLDPSMSERRAVKVRGSVAWSVVLVGLASSCGSDGGSAAPRCVPGETQLCYGVAACRGAQYCLPEGTSYSACDCGSLEAEGGAAGSAADDNPEGGAMTPTAGGELEVAGRGGAGSHPSGGGGATAGSNSEAAGSSNEAGAGTGGSTLPTFAVDWARAVSTGATPQEIVADPAGGFHLSGSLTTANFGNGVVKGNWFAVDRKADGSHVAARVLDSGSTPALYRAVRVGPKGNFVSVGGVDSYYDDLTYDTNELRITSSPGFVRAFGAGKSTNYVTYDGVAVAVAADGRVFYSSSVAVPFDGTNGSTAVVFAPDGKVAWASLEKPSAGAFLSSGNLLTVGSLSGSKDFGGGPISGRTYFVERDAAGNHVASWGLDAYFLAPWLRRTPAYAVIEGLVSNGAFPPNLAGYDLAFSETRGWLTIALDSAGHYHYAGVWPTVMSDSGAALTPVIHSATDASGRTFICGHFWRHITAFGQTFTVVGTTDKDSDIIIAALNADGTVLFAKTFGGAGADTCADIAIDASGGVLITGQYQSSLDFGAGPLESTTHAVTDPLTFYIARFAVE